MPLSIKVPAMPYSGLLAVSAMLLPRGLSTFCSFCYSSLLLGVSLGWFPHHHEICLNVTFFIRSWLPSIPPASLSPYLSWSITLTVLQYILGHSLYPSLPESKLQEGRHRLFCSLLYPQAWESSWHLIVLKYLNERMNGWNSFLFFIYFFGHTAWLVGS